MPAAKITIARRRGLFGVEAEGDEILLDELEHAVVEATHGAGRALVARRPDPHRAIELRCLDSIAELAHHVQALARRHRLDRLDGGLQVGLAVVVGERVEVAAEVVEVVVEAAARHAEAIQQRAELDRRDPTLTEQVLARGEPVVAAEGCAGAGHGRRARPRDCGQAPTSWQAPGTPAPGAASAQGDHLVERRATPHLGLAVDHRPDLVVRAETGSSPADRAPGSRAAAAGAHRAPARRRAGRGRG